MVAENEEWIVHSFQYNQRVCLQYSLFRTSEYLRAQTACCFSQSLPGWRLKSLNNGKWKREYLATLDYNLSFAGYIGLNRQPEYYVSAQ